jgi:pyruvate dehydrogenase E2 component (dihydrolipoamide acetyltransferase)
MATAVLMPRQGQSVESCILVEWLVKVGDTVAEGAPLANIETDKAVFEVESPAAGTIVELFSADGDDIPVLQNIAAIGDAGEDVSALRPGGEGAAVEAAAPAAAEAPAESVEAVQAAAPVAALQGDTHVGVSPRARSLAKKTGVNAIALAGSGPGGRVIEREVEAAAAGQPRLSAAARDAAAAGQLSAPAQGTGPGGMVLAADLTAAPEAGVAPMTPTGEPTVIPLTGIRKLIAGRMHQSLASTAQLTMNMSFDATGILAYRAKVKAQGEVLGLPNITINDIVAYATVQTLLSAPEINAHFLGDKTVQYPYVNLGIATDTERGLMVPVVRGASQMSLCQLSDAIKPLLSDCQSGGINPDLLSGGTFTITNMGMLGVESFTPVLNVPEVAILGVGGLSLKPVMKDGTVTHVQAINLSLTVDHQVVDGAPAARFLKTLCASLESFELTLAK